MKTQKNTISKIVPGGIAEELSVEVGDILLAINGKPVVDIMDYLFFMSDDYLTLTIEKKTGEIWDLEIDKEYDEDLGIEFDNPILDMAKSCRNKCIFCFIDQLPPGMRETLYFKDDDSRLAFLQGNFVTLTNVSDRDLERMVEYHISPVNVSIHTTNPELRERMLCNRFAGKIMERLIYLTDNGIEVNGQVVLCKDVNDGIELDRTINDLAGMENRIRSLAVVPFGMTKYREGLYPVECFTREDARRIVKQVHALQKRFLELYGTRFVFLSDEFYLTAGVTMPAYSKYEGFIQIENGVGLIRRFEEEIKRSLRSERRRLIKVPHSHQGIFVTGTAASGFMEQVAGRMMDVYGGMKIQVAAIVNDFFGDKVTVSGLLTGKDIVSQLKLKYPGGLAADAVLFLPETMFKSEEDIFLDDMTLEDLRLAMGCRAIKVPVDGRPFVSLVHHALTPDNMEETI